MSETGFVKAIESASSLADLAEIEARIKVHGVGQEVASRRQRTERAEISRK